MKETGAVRGDACKIGAKEDEIVREMRVGHAVTSVFTKG